jgi:hypothetical protein
MTNKAVISNKSALEKKVKLNILVEEGLRRMRNVNPGAKWEETAKHLDEFQLEIREAGYPTKFRDRILDMVVGKYQKEMEKHWMWEEGNHDQGSPCYRTGEERESQKEEKKGDLQSKEGWYRKGGYTSILWIPATPEGELMENIKEELAKSKGPAETKIKLVQRGGVSTASSLVKSNPFVRKNCGRRECVNCRQGGEQGSEGKCYKSGIGYRGECVRCPAESRSKGAAEPDIQHAFYHGESSKTFFRRTIQHHDAYVKKKDKSWMWNHVLEDHEGVIRGDGLGDFKFTVTGTFKDPTQRVADEAVRLARDERGEHDTVEGKVKILNDKTEFYTAKDVRITTTQF